MWYNMIWYDMMWYQRESTGRWQDKTRQEKTRQDNKSRQGSNINRNLKKSSPILMYTRMAKWYMKLIMKMKARKQNRMRGTNLQ